MRISRRGRPAKSVEAKSQASQVALEELLTRIRTAHIRSCTCFAEPYPRSIGPPAKASKVGDPCALLLVRRSHGNDVKVGPCGQRCTAHAKGGLNGVGAGPAEIRPEDNEPMLTGADQPVGDGHANARRGQAPRFHVLDPEAMAAGL